MKQIKIITAVERIPVTSLSGMKRLSETTVRLPYGISWIPLAVKPHAQLTISDKAEDKNTVWTAKLVFKTCEEIAERNHWAYRCRLIDGRYRLIGTDERPYPVTSVSESIPERVTENQLSEVTVTWNSDQYIPYIAD